MAVKVQVIGPINGQDIEVYGHDAIIERIQSKEEVVYVKDANNILLAIIPLANVRYMMPVAGDSPVSLGENASINLHIVGDSTTDLSAVGNRVEYARKYDTVNVELLTITQTGEGQLNKALEAVVPFGNIRYMDLNYNSQVGASVEPTQSEVEGQNPAQETVEKPTSKGQRFSISGKKK